MVMKMDITYREIVWGVSMIKYKGQFLSAKVWHETWIKNISFRFWILPVNILFKVHIVKNKLITYVCIYHKCNVYIYNYALCVLLYIFLITAITWMYVFFLSTHLFYSLYKDAWFYKNWYKFSFQNPTYLYQLP